jgi:hypothetical protein
VSKPKDKKDKWIKHNFANPHETADDDEEEREVRRFWKRERAKYLRRKDKPDKRDYQ